MNAQRLVAKAVDDMLNDQQEPFSQSNLHYRDGGIYHFNSCMCTLLTAEPKPVFAVNTHHYSQSTGKVQRHISSVLADKGYKTVSVERIPLYGLGTYKLVEITANELRALAREQDASHGN